MPVIRPGFVAAVFWNGTERRKLWRAVGEKLSYDVYAGEVFPANVAVTLEIWSVETSANPIVNAEWQIPIAALELPTDFVDNTGTGIQLATLCLTHDETPADLDEYLAKCNL